MSILCINLKLTDIQGGNEGREVESDRRRERWSERGGKSKN